MRTKKSIINIIVSVFNNIINIIIGLVAQAVFLKILGEKYLGLNGIFVNTLSLLAIAELGIGSAVIYNLYEPIEKKDKERIKQLISFYKKCYKYIIIIMTLIAFAIIPFLKQIVGEINGIKENIYLIYSFFFIDVILSYFIAYKKTILTADQKEYIVNIVHIIYLITMNVFQIVFLIYTKNYFIYLIIKVFARLLENIIIIIVVNKKYKYLNEDVKQDLDSKTKDDIFKKMKALFLHKIAGFIVTGTDTILISIFLGGLASVGYYSNYNLIYASLTTVFSQVFISITASVGNLLVSSNKAKQYEVFKKLEFLNFYIYLIASTCVFCAIKPFICIWIGTKYLLPNIVVVSLTLNFFLQGMRRTTIAFKEAAGIFYQDRFMPILESIINLIASIMFLKILGLSGVMFGTVTSTLLLYTYSYPKYVYNNLFARKRIEYIIIVAKYLIISMIVVGLSGYITTLIDVHNLYLSLMINLAIAIFIPNIIIFILYKKNDYYKFYINFIVNFFKKGNEKHVV